MLRWTYSRETVPVVLVLLAAGCDSGDPRLVPVFGQITLGGGAWPAEGTLTFSPVAPAEGCPAIPGTAEFTTDGSFQVQTFKPGDGLMPGRYKLGVECWEQPPTYTDLVGKNSHVPPAYRAAETSPLEIVVQVDASEHEVTAEVPRP